MHLALEDEIGKYLWEEVSEGNDHANGVEVFDHLSAFAG